VVRALNAFFFRKIWRSIGNVTVTAKKVHDLYVWVSVFFVFADGVSLPTFRQI
jgi:hypothetical protein